MAGAQTEVKSRETPQPAPDFAFLTNHGKTLLLIAQDTRIKLRELADRLQITERATHRIVNELVRAGYVDREREGRRNRYSVRTHLPLGLPIQRDIDIESLLALVFGQDDPRSFATVEKDPARS